MSEYDRISARDEFSAGLAREALGGAADRVRVAGDLATLALKQVVFPKGRRTAKSLILAGDTLQDQDLVAVAEYLAGAKSTVDFIVNDVSPYDTMEQALYRRVAPRRFFGLARRGTLRIPDYDTADWRELLVPYRSSEVVVSTRYHGLLCSAYSGCRTGAIARSSKVAALASQLKVPFCTPPLTAAKIADVFDNACLVDASILRGMEARALDGIDFCLRS